MIPNDLAALVSAPDICGRIAAHDRSSYIVRTVDGDDIRAQVSGSLRYQACVQEDYPVVGDYVLSKHS